MMSNTEINEQVIVLAANIQVRNRIVSWKTVGIRIRQQDLPVLNHHSDYIVLNIGPVGWLISYLLISTIDRG